MKRDYIIIHICLINLLYSHDVLRVLTGVILIALQLCPFAPPTDVSTTKMIK